jgi:predicted sulfurtransferase
LTIDDFVATCCLVVNIRCASTVLGTSILERLGFKHVTNVIGGIAAYTIYD